MPAYAPYCVSMPSESSWAKLPLIPASPKLAIQHQLLAMLDSERAIFNDDTNCKDENRYYLHLSEQQAAEVDHRGRRLESGIAEVRLRAGNELRWSAGGGGGGGGGNTERMPQMRESHPRGSWRTERRTRAIRLPGARPSGARRAPSDRP